MKYTKIQLTGWEGFADDIQYMQDGAIDAFSAIVKGLSKDDNGFRLWGLDMTLSGGDLILSWTAGAVAMNGEILLVDAGSISRPSTSGHTWKFKAVDDWGQTVYTGSGLQDTRNNRKATLVSQFNVYPITYTAYDSPYLKEIIHPNFEVENTNSGTWSAEHGVSGAVAWTVTSSDYKYRLCNKQLHVNVEVVWSSLAADAEVLDIELPDGLLGDGNYFGVAWVNGESCLLRSMDGFGVVRVYGTFPAGTVSVTLQLSLQVQ